MKRREFIRNVFMAFAVTLLPEILRPSEGVVESGGFIGMIPTIKRSGVTYYVPDELKIADIKNLFK